MSLAAWHALSTDAAHVVACFGDSTTEGTGVRPSQAWPFVLSERMRSAWGRASLGFRGPWVDEWTIAGSPTQSTTSDTWDRGPFSVDILQSTVYRLNTSSDIFTYNVVGGPLAHLTLYVIDGPSSGNFSYSIDGGSFTNVSATWAQDLSMDKIVVTGPITTSLRIRGANAAGTATLCYFVGAEPDYNTSGATVHNVASAASFSIFMVRTTSGDWSAWLDKVQPAVAIWMWTNDVTALWNPANWQTRLETFVTRVRANNGEPILMSFYEQDTRSHTDQAEARARVKTVAAAQACPIIDMFDLVGNAAAAAAAGYIALTEVHATVKGHRFIADQVFNLLGKQNSGVRCRV